jgi:SAM-dependent methyltransferase
MRKLQLGSGSNHLPGWLNTDSHIVRTNNAYLNIVEAFPFPDETFHYIFCEHTIEHIGFNDAAAMLSECHRVLSPGGKIRLATPNLAVYVKLYEGGEEAIGKECIAELFNSWIVPGFYEAKNYRPLSSEPSALFVINDLFRNYEHKFIYDFKTLVQLLEHTGFGNICECSASASFDENLNGLETHNDRVNSFLTVVVEAQK